MPASQELRGRAGWEARRRARKLERVSRNPALEAGPYQDQDQDEDEDQYDRTTTTTTCRSEFRDRSYRPHGPPRIECADDLGELLRCHRAGDLEPVPVPGLPPLPFTDEPAEKLYALLVKRFGLRLAEVGVVRPLMLATSELVKENIVPTKGGASFLLHRFEDAGLIHYAGSLEPLGKGDGTRTFLPGPAEPVTWEQAVADWEREQRRTA